MATIAITDDLGPLGWKIARDLGKSLSLRFIDGLEIEDMVAKRLRLTRIELQEIIDSSPGPMDRWTINRNRLGEVLGRQLIELAEQGNVILRYAGSAPILHARGDVICVRLTASDTVRARVIADHFRYGDLRMAYWDLESGDVDLERRAHMISPVDWRSSTLYDAVIDADAGSHLDCVRAIVTLVNRESRSAQYGSGERRDRSDAAAVNEVTTDLGCGRGS